MFSQKIDPYLARRTTVQLRQTIERADPVEDAELIEKYENEIDRRVQLEIASGERYPLKTYVCPKCRCESVHLSKEKKIKRCLNCYTVIADDRIK